MDIEREEEREGERMPEFLKRQITMLHTLNHKGYILKDSVLFGLSQTWFVHVTQKTNIFLFTYTSVMHTVCFKHSHALISVNTFDKLNKLQKEPSSQVLSWQKKTEAKREAEVMSPWNLRLIDNSGNMSVRISVFLTPKVLY